MLYIFAGLPATGKSTLARMLAHEIQAVYLRIDTIEQGLIAAGGSIAGPEGYAVAYRIAEDNLRLGLTVVADSVNPIELTRSAWRDIATQANVNYTEIEVICSDALEHQRRVESRTADIVGHALPTWQDVRDREYETWPSDHLILDTARQTIEQSYARLKYLLNLTTHE